MDAITVFAITFGLAVVLLVYIAVRIVRTVTSVFSHEDVDNTEELPE